MKPDIDTTKKHGQYKLTNCCPSKMILLYYYIIFLSAPEHFQFPWSINTRLQAYKFPFIFIAKERSHKINRWWSPGT